MVKRGALSKVEKYYIEGNCTLPIEDIAKELDRSVNSVTKYIDTLTTTTSDTPATETVKAAVDGEPQMFKVMGRHERNGENVATVMTSAASELADATRSKRIMNKKLQSAIHKPIKDRK